MTFIGYEATLYRRTQRYAIAESFFTDHYYTKLAISNQGHSPFTKF
jgi:hypothetical protein